jgi:Skp family chaperone for outer membrane proteins
VNKVKYATIFVMLLLLAGASYAQQAAPSVPVSQEQYTLQALGQRLTDEINKELQWQAAALAAQDQVKALQKELDEVKKPKGVGANDMPKPTVPAK